MNDAELITEEGVPPNVKVLRLVDDSSGEDTQYTLWIDTQQGFMPVRYEVARVWPPVVSRRIVMDVLKEVEPGVWIPMEGRETVCAAVKPIFPDGLTEDEWVEQRSRTMTEAELCEVAKQEVRWEIKELGVGEVTTIVDEETLVVNEPLSGNEFTFAYNKGDMVYDAFQQRGWQVGRDDDPALAVKALPQSPLRIWLVVLSILGLIVAVSVAVWRRRATP